MKPPLQRAQKELMMPQASASRIDSDAPSRFRIVCRFVDNGAAGECVLEGPWGEPVENDAVAVAFDEDGAAFTLVLDVRERLQVVACDVVFDHRFERDERIVLNGYQSWTETHERSPWSKMRGLHGVPRPLIDRFVLDGSGDYRFVDYPNRAGLLHGFTYATIRRGARAHLFASACERDGFTLIRTDARQGTITLSKECPAAPLDAGAQVHLCRMFSGAGGLDVVYDAWFEAMGVSARPVPALTGYTSWYRHYGDIDTSCLLHDLEGAARYYERADAERRQTADVSARVLRVFQIDDGYAKVGDWGQVDARKFPDGLAPLADAAVQAGFVPGLWVSPFVCERTSHLFAEHADWLLRDDAGAPVQTGCHWSGGYALDTLNPDVRAYTERVLRTMTQTWGFRLLKVDFLYAACMVGHGGMNRGQLMADAMKLVRDAVGDQVMLLGCGVPLASAFGIVDYCRIGCDVGLDWDDKPHIRLLHRERVSTKNSREATLARKPLDGRAFGNDPDVFFLRDDVKLTRRQRLDLLETDAACGSVLLTSDDMGAWEPWQRSAYDGACRMLEGRDDR